MDQKKPDEKKYFIRCLRCRRKSSVEGVAQCSHCGSFAVRLLTKGKRK